MIFASNLVLFPVFYFRHSPPESVLLSKQIAFGKWQLKLNQGEMLRFHLDVTYEQGMAVCWSLHMRMRGLVYGAENRMVLLGGVRQISRNGQEQPCYVVWGNVNGKPKHVQKEEDGLLYHVGQRGLCVVAREDKAAENGIRFDMFAIACEGQPDQGSLKVRAINGSAQTRRWRQLISQAGSGFRQHCVK